MNQSTRFGVRRRLYKQISGSFGEVRSAELSIVLDFMPSHFHGFNVLEIGSGTGFLTGYLLNLGFSVDAIDTEFAEPAGVNMFWTFDVKTGLPAELPHNHYNIIISLAAMHHIADMNTHTAPEPFYSQCQRVLKPGGKLLLIDVAPEEDAGRSGFWNSARTGSFFHNIVDKYCVPPHQGVYMKSISTTRSLKKVGFVDIIHKDYPCPWCFRNEETMCTFFKQLFNLKRLEHLQIGTHLMEYIGYCRENGIVMLDWALQAFSAVKSTK